MKLHELSPAEGSSTKAWRKGRGPGSGNGKTGGRGHKGQNARSGGGVRLGFEGGQLPLYRKLPKRGFNNKFGKEYAQVNIGVLDAAFENGSEIDLAVLREKGIIKNEKDGLKVLGNGAITKQFTVRAKVFSASAKEKIEAAGGKTEVV
ncbi:MAG: 50S ribosomal protein L15 [Clostridia bacterium]|nr:50S ribosomal protein L15 [Clostridia bacterium]